MTVDGVVGLTGAGCEFVLRRRTLQLLQRRPFCDSIRAMGDGLESLPDDIETLKAALIVARAEAATARARQSDDQALIVPSPTIRASL